jgi:hypothetical protein
MVTWIQIAAGIVLVLTGKRFLWLFLGVIGFFVTHGLVLQYLPDLSGQTTMIISLVGAGLAAALVLLAEKVAVIGGGLLGGGYVGAVVWQLLAPQSSGMPWVAIAIGAILGVIVARFVVKFALTIISSAVGAALIANALPETDYRMVVFFVVLAAGLVVQSGLLGQKSSSGQKENEQE